MQLLIQANAAELPLPDGSVQTCVTSPPYWGLRAYIGAQEFAWGGDPDCEHDWLDTSVSHSRLNDATAGAKQRTNSGAVGWRNAVRSSSSCSRCGAWRGALGAEPTPELYVEHLVTVFREVRRVLRDDGTLWLNLGDSYYGSWGNYSGGKRGIPGGQRPINVGTSVATPAYDGRKDERPVASFKHPTLKPKDLVGIPWRAALALQADGWYLRSDVIWSKPNIMPASVTDRPTNSHEHLFLLTKSERYFYDHVAIQEPAVTAFGTRNARTVWTIATQPFKGKHFAVMPPALVRRCLAATTSKAGACVKCGTASLRFTTKATGAHSGSGTADREPDGKGALTLNGGNKQLWRGPVLSWTTTGWSPGCICDSADRRVIQSPTGGRGLRQDDPTLHIGRAGMARPRAASEGRRPMTRWAQQEYARQLKVSAHRKEMEVEAGSDSFAHYLRIDNSGARPIPEHLLAQWLGAGWLTEPVMPDEPESSVRPCLVLDPFGGSGTVAAVCKEMALDSIHIDLAYHELARGRLRKVVDPQALYG